jgi:DNA-binding transcriptional ArsR family regulator
MAAGEVAEALQLAPNTLTFHFDRLRQAGLVIVKREGRSMIYAARHEAMNGLLSFLSDNCCAGIAKPNIRAKSKTSSGANRSKKQVPAD